MILRNYSGAIVTRAEAKQIGTKLYFTGVPCIRGHVDQRVTKTACCCQCQRDRYKSRYVAKKEQLAPANRAKARKWYADNRERKQAYDKKYRERKQQILKHQRALAYQKNKPAIDAKNAAWRAANREKDRAAKAAWRASNITKARNISRKYKLSHPMQSRLEATKRRARQKRADGHHTAEQIANLLLLQHTKCANCRHSIKGRYHIDHIVPLVRGGSNSIGNIQLLCPGCNLRKNDKDPFLWANSQGRLL